MSDLIDRQAAIETVDFECGEWRGLAGTIVNGLKNLPAVDAAPVIRCKYCKYWDVFPSSSLAPEFHKCKGLGVHTVANFFCSKGDRKDG